LKLSPQSSLATYLTAYVSERDLAPRTVDNYHQTLRTFAKHLRFAPRIEDLNPEVINDYLSARQVIGLSPKTIRNEQILLSVLWKAAYEAAILPTPPQRVKRVKVRMGPPVAWDEHQLAALLAVAAGHRGHLRTHRIPKAAFFVAFIQVAFDSGLRFADLLQLSWTQIAENGGIHICQEKTGWPHFARLRPETLASLEGIRQPERVRIFGDGLGRRQFFVQFGRLVKYAGLQGGSRMLRRTGASLLERVCPGAAMGYLGHKTHGLAFKHYVDPSVAHQGRPLPPSVTTPPAPPAPLTKAENDLIVRDREGGAS
jgi:integrase